MLTTTMTSNNITSTQDNTIIGRLRLKSVYFNTGVGNRDDGTYFWTHFEDDNGSGLFEELVGDVTRDDKMYLLSASSQLKDDFVRNIADYPGDFVRVDTMAKFRRLQHGAVIFAYYDCDGDDPRNFGWYRCTLQL
jgi:hypothetical protein